MKTILSLAMAAALLAIFSTETRADESPQSLATQILNDAKPAADREALAALHIGESPQLIAAMTADLPNDSTEEYKRIPWIWRVALAAGKRNDAAELKSSLDVALPKEGEPLRDWQAVVIGGGIINGLSQQNIW